MAARSFGIHKPTITIDYDAKASAIVVLVNEDRQDVAIPLEFTFTYHPDQGFVPIHEVTEGRKRIKVFDWCLWVRCSLRPTTTGTSSLALK